MNVLTHVPPTVRHWVYFCFVVVCLVLFVLGLATENDVVDRLTLVALLLGVPVNGMAAVNVAQVDD